MIFTSVFKTLYQNNPQCLLKCRFPGHQHKKVKSEVAQSCPTLCKSIGGLPPCSPVPGILQARTLECVAISFSNAWKWKVKVKSLSRVRLLATPWTAAYQAPRPWDFPGDWTELNWTEPIGRYLDCFLTFPTTHSFDMSYFKCVSINWSSQRVCLFVIW